MIKRAILFIPCILFAISSIATEIQNIPVHSLKVTPIIDGNGSDWADIPAVVIPLHNSLENSKITLKSIELKAGVQGDFVYFHLLWADSSQDMVHKPFIWNEEKNRYIRGMQREDRVALQFLMHGDYDTNWLSGKEFVADMWHWKAYRSSVSNKADDKMTTISLSKILRAHQGKTNKGQTVYILRTVDTGDKIYKMKVYGKKQKNIMPKYILNATGSGSRWDIDAKGVWKAGYWTVELRRKLDTQQEDDAKFILNQSILGGISVFNHSENNDHAISHTLNFQF